MRQFQTCRGQCAEFATGIAALDQALADRRCRETKNFGTIATRRQRPPIAIGVIETQLLLHYGSVLEKFMDLSVKGVPEEQVKLLRERAKANHRSLQGELRALIDEATSVARRRLTVDEVAERVSQLGLTRREDAARWIREDRDR
jgi:hypothetical protein